MTSFRWIIGKNIKEKVKVMPVHKSTGAQVHKIEIGVNRIKGCTINFTDKGIFSSLNCIFI